MIITKKAISRRTVLRGVGMTLALPLLDAMVPALTAQAKTAAAKRAQRYGFFYLPNGVAMTHADVNYWKPTTVGADFAISPILKPLEAFKDKLTVVSGLHHRSSESIGDGNGDHTRSTGTWLTGSHIKRTEGSDMRAGTSIDQVIAQWGKKETVLPSLELAVLPDNVTNAAGCDAGYSCAYQTTLAWATPTTPLPTQSSPRLVFEQLFGEGGTSADQAALLRQRGSILDSATAELAALEKRLGASERRVVNEYVNSMREVERRIQQAEKSSADSPMVTLDRPGIGMPERFDEHATLMFDLMLLAFQGDITRVSTFMYGAEQRNRPYPEMGFNEGHHAMSHHGDNPENLERYAKLNTWHLSLFASLIDKMAKTQDGDGTLLDHSLMMIGGGMSNANIHSHMDLPIALVGGAGGFKGNRHIATPMGTPMSNLLVKVANNAGIPITEFSDSTGVLSLDV